MRHIQVGLLSADEEGRKFLAGSWGKSSTATDITIYTVQHQSTLQTTIVPNGFPKKILSAVYTAHMSDLVVLGVSKLGIDHDVGELALLADAMKIKGIAAVIGTDTQGYDHLLKQLEKVFSKLSISKWPNMVITDGKNATTAREKIHSIYQQPRCNTDSYLAIETDHAFPVQGVGSVILGTVISGTVSKSQKIKVFPSGQTGQVRSIQVNDENVNSASAGIHVGLAMKGILPKYLQRGTVITSADTDNVIETDFVENLSINKAAFGKPPIIGTKIHLVSGLFDAPGKVIEWGNQVSIKLDKQIPMYNDIRVTILNLNEKPMILGSRKFS